MKIYENTPWFKFKRTVMATVVFFVPRERLTTYKHLSLESNQVWAKPPQISRFLRVLGLKVGRSER